MQWFSIRFSLLRSMSLIVSQIQLLIGTQQATALPAAVLSPAHKPIPCLLSSLSLTVPPVAGPDTVHNIVHVCGDKRRQHYSLGTQFRIFNKRGSAQSINKQVRGNLLVHSLNRWE
ncbi:hypothetical protein F5Y14DRAFT_168640 [Nemania sp. NC0429]|nr:hypothetical protein F5Y14DRAFT_168640 [Nemania sp. NC0429]